MCVWCAVKKLEAWLLALSFSAFPSSVGHQASTACRGTHPWLIIPERFFESTLHVNSLTMKPPTVKSIKLSGFLEHVINFCRYKY